MAKSNAVKRPNATHATPATDGDGDVVLYQVAAGRSVEHDGQAFGEGEQLELTAQDAQALVDVGVLLPVKAP